MRATRGHIPGRRGLSGVWYSGWYNGLAKKHALNLPLTKAGIHNVIVYCKANPDKKIIQAIDLMLKAGEEVAAALRAAADELRPNRLSPGWEHLDGSSPSAAETTR